MKKISKFIKSYKYVLIYLILPSVLLIFSCILINFNCKCCKIKNDNKYLDSTKIIYYIDSINKNNNYDFIRIHKDTLGFIIYNANNELLLSFLKNKTDSLSFETLQIIINANKQLK